MKINIYMVIALLATIIQSYYFIDQTTSCIYKHAYQVQTSSKLLFAYKRTRTKSKHQSNHVLHIKGRVHLYQVQTSIKPLFAYKSTRTKPKHQSKHFLHTKGSVQSPNIDQITSCIQKHGYQVQTSIKALSAYKSTRTKSKHQSKHFLHIKGRVPSPNINQLLYIQK